MSSEGSRRQKTGDGTASFEPPSIASGGFDAFLFKVAELVSSVLMVVLTGRLMGPSGRGLYALASLSVGICQVPFGSVWVANAVELARKRATPRELFGCRSSSRWAAASPRVSSRSRFPRCSETARWVLALPSLITPFVLLRAYARGDLAGAGARASGQRAQARSRLASVPFILPPLLADASTRTTIVIWELAFVVLAATAWLRLRAFLRGPQFPRDRNIYRASRATG